MVFVGPIFNDINTVGWTTLLPEHNMIHIGLDYVNIKGRCYSNILMNNFLEKLACTLSTQLISKKDTALIAFKRFQNTNSTKVEHIKQQSNLMLTSKDIYDRSLSKSPLIMLDLCYHLQSILTSKSDLIVEAGDAWFIGQRMHLPNGARFHVQMQYGSIGWSIGAMLGIGLAVNVDKQKLSTNDNDREVIGIIGDGSFQMTCQEISTMIKENINIIIFVINNNGYTIEVEIHDGPYNKIKDWKYSQLIKCFNTNTNSITKGFNVYTSYDLHMAIDEARKMYGVKLIECHIDRDDCTAELLEWGSSVAAASGRPHV